jgi:hypothetical protein
MFLKRQTGEMVGGDIRAKIQLSAQADRASGVLVLSSAASKRLIAKAVVELPQVQRALKAGRVIITNGTTNAYVVEELLGESVAKYNYAGGYIAHGQLTATSRDVRWPPCVLVKGSRVDTPVDQVLREFGAEDVFIKGANALDTGGCVGILVAGDTGGTIGAALPILASRGAQLIVPVGLEKLVPSVQEAASKCGQSRFDYVMGRPVGLVPVMNATVVTEIQALSVLFQVDATHVASGGIGGYEGAVTLVVEGSRDAVRSAFQLAEAIKTEPAIAVGLA